MKEAVGGADIISRMQQRHMDLFARPDVHPNEFRQFEHDLKELLNDNPDHPVLLFSLGTFYMQMEQTALACALLRRSMECGAAGAAPWLNLAAAYKSNHIDDEAEECYRKALNVATAEEDELSKNHAMHGIGSLYINRGEPDTAIYWSEKALKIDPNDRHAMWNKGLASLEKGDFETGFRLYHEAGFIADPKKRPERKIKDYNGVPQWDGKPKADGSKPLVVCYGEQGVGDEVMFASMLPDLFKDCDVILDVDKRLENLMRDSFPEAKGVFTTSSIGDRSPWLKDYPDLDAMVPMGSLGYWYRKKKSDFPKVPFFKANEEKRAKWRELLKPYKGLKVGLSYWGGLKKTRTDKRSIPLDRFGDVFKVEGINWFSMQYHDWSADVAARVGTGLNTTIHHWQDAIEDWDEMAAFISELDLVITVNNSLHHLAGALGVKQWCLTPKYVAWRYGTQGPSPWYGNCEMFRQKKDDDWHRVLKDVETELRALTAQEVAA